VKISSQQFAAEKRNNNEYKKQKYVDAKADE